MSIGLRIPLKRISAGSHHSFFMIVVFNNHRFSPIQHLNSFSLKRFHQYFYIITFHKKRYLFHYDLVNGTRKKERHMRHMQIFYSTMWMSILYSAK